MVQLFSKYWWTFAVRGGLPFLWVGHPVVAGSSLIFLVVSFGIFSLLQGILSVYPRFSELGEGSISFSSKGWWGSLAGSSDLF